MQKLKITLLTVAMSLCTTTIHAETPPKFINNNFEPTESMEVTPYFSKDSENSKLVLKLKERKLYLYQNDVLIRTFKVAIGKPGWETPVGNWKITDKIVNPAWTNFKTGAIVKPGAKNPLGSRWIEFWKQPNGKDSIGFHGTTDLSSIGKNKSHGCVRMFPKDVEYLFDKVNVGTIVKVV